MIDKSPITIEKKKIIIMIQLQTRITHTSFFNVVEITYRRKSVSCTLNLINERRW